MDTTKKAGRPIKYISDNERKLARIKYNKDYAQKLKAKTILKNKIYDMYLSNIEVQKFIEDYKNL